tara:strand:+ start:1706 stop:2029 length:324 start_codon:yes stop_codon:yes gene_type:complete
MPLDLSVNVSPRSLTNMLKSVFVYGLVNATLFIMANKFLLPELNNAMDNTTAFAIMCNLMLLVTCVVTQVFNVYCMDNLLLNVIGISLSTGVVVGVVNLLNLTPVSV